MAFFDPIRYGWHVTYAVEIEGIPLLWSESPTGRADTGAGYTEPTDKDGRGVLVMDLCGELGQVVDRATGIGAGQPLTFALRQCTAVEAYLRKPTKECHLASDLTAGAVTAEVDSTAGWVVSADPNDNIFWIDKEAIGYTGIAAGPPRFTALLRGLYGSLASSHSSTNSGRSVTDLPRWWRGRQVRLWAYATTPTGFICSDRREMWRGHLNTGPDLVDRMWRFEALSLDRRLADDVLLSISATVTKKAAWWPVYKSDEVWWTGFGSSQLDFSMKFYPFANEANGAMKTLAEQAVLVSAAFETAIAAATNSITGLQDLAAMHGPLTFSFAYDSNNTTFAMIQMSSPFGCMIHVYLNGASPQYNAGKWWYADQALTLWRSDGQLIEDGNKDIFAKSPPLPPSLTVDLGANADATITSTGWLVDDNKVSIWFGSRTVSGEYATFSDLRTGPAPLGTPAAVPASWIAGTNVKITTQPTPKTFAAFALTMLESSGDANRGIYDTEASNAGYGFDGDTSGKSAINVASFAYYGSPGNGLTCHSPSEDKTSFSRVCSGMLAVQQTAVVARCDTTETVRLNLVDVSTLGGATTFDITDDDLLLGADPVVTVRKRSVPNMIEIEAIAVSGEPQKVTVIDAPLVREQGTVIATYSLPVVAVDPVQAASWAESILLSEQTSQAVEVRVGPWIPADVGDLGWLTTDHFGVWSWQSGSLGYTGAARVLGCRIHPISLVKTLTLMIDAGSSTSLCPAAVVTATDDLVDPTWVKVARKFFAYFSASFTSNGGFDLLHYRPGMGDEAGGESYTVSAVTDNGTDCVLSVVKVGVPVLVLNSSVLTIPESGASTVDQLRLAHDLDGSSWL